MDLQISGLWPCTTQRNHKHWPLIGPRIHILSGYSYLRYVFQRTIIQIKSKLISLKVLLSATDRQALRKERASSLPPNVMFGLSHAYSARLRPGLLVVPEGLLIIENGDDISIRRYPVFKILDASTMAMVEYTRSSRSMSGV